MDFRFDIVVDYMPFFLKGMGITIAVSLAGVLAGLVLGLLIAFGKMSTNKWIQLPFNMYINVFRGTPLLVQLLIIHFGVVPLFMERSDPLVSLVLGLSLNAAAYIAEIFRAGIQSIDKGQMEAARSLGMTKRQAMKLVILPQAIKRVIPPLGNEFIVLLKESSLGSVLAAPELMYWGRAASGEYIRVWEPYLTVAVIYLVLTLTLTHLMNYIERRMSASDHR